MATRSKAYLGTAITCSVLGLALVAGWINAKNAVSLYVLLPVGAIFFGMFMMANLFENDRPTDAKHSTEDIESHS